jgi:hypothetical protein
MRKRRLRRRKDQGDNTGDLGALIQRIEEAVTQAGDQLERAGERMIAKAEDDLRELDRPDLQAAAEADPQVREVLARTESNGFARIKWLRAVAEARRDGVEQSKQALTGLLETALRERS